MSSIRNFVVLLGLLPLVAHAMYMRRTMLPGQRTVTRMVRPVNTVVNQAMSQAMGPQMGMPMGPMMGPMPMMYGMDPMDGPDGPDLPDFHPAMGPMGPMVPGMMGPGPAAPRTVQRVTKTSTLVRGPLPGGARTAATGSPGASNFPVVMTNAAGGGYRMVAQPDSMVVINGQPVQVLRTGAGAVAQPAAPAVATVVRKAAVAQPQTVIVRETVQQPRPVVTQVVQQPQVMQPQVMQPAMMRPMGGPPGMVLTNGRASIMMPPFDGTVNMGGRSYTIDGSDISIGS